MFILGQNSKSISSLELLLNADLLWSVQKQESTIIGIDGEPLKTGVFSILREDNNTILGNHKEDYGIVQNQQLADIILELSQKADIPVHAAGMLQGGKKIFIQLKTSNLNLGGDLIKGFLTAINSFDGSTSLAFGNSTTTISCMNTFFGAYKDMDSKMKHTKSIQIRIDALLKSVDSFRKEELSHFEIIRRMAEAPITQKALDVVYDGIFGVKFADSTNKELVSTKKLNLVNQFNANLIGETRQKGENIWGLFSGITKTSTPRAEDMTAAQFDQKSTVKMFGTVAKTERTLFDKLAELVN